MWRTLMLLTLAGASTVLASDFDQPVAALSPDGRAHWVITCGQQDVCFEAAYQFCHGAYTAIERHFIPKQGFHFVCKQPTAATTPHPEQAQSPSSQ
jgi:hypothetical protein